MQVHKTPAPLTYRIKDAACAIGVSRRTVERWIERKTLPATRIGRVTLIPAAAVHAVVSGEA